MIKGMVIAGYFPGIVTYFSLWYPRRQQIMRIAVFSMATFGSGVLVGVLVIIPKGNFISLFFIVLLCRRTLVVK